MDSLVYVHHDGQRLLPDSKSRIASKIKEKNFIELLYDLTYSVPTKTYGKNQTCQQYNEHSFDYCIANVIFYLGTNVLRTHLNIYTTI